MVSPMGLEEIKDSSPQSTTHMQSTFLVLVTSPDDWWFTIVNKVALVIDENSRNPRVRQFFVHHEGKKELVVRIPSADVNYDWFLQQFAAGVRENINVPRYVEKLGVAYQLFK